MEVVASVVGSLLAEPCRALFTFLRDKIRNPLHFTANLRALDKEMEDLMERRNQLREHLALSATAGIQAPSQVRDWLGQVNRLEDQVRSLKHDLALRAGNSACSYCLCCTNLSDQAAHRLGEARKLTSDGEFLQCMAGPDPSIVRSEYIPAPTIDDQATASRNMAKVMDLLSSKDVKRIGIWGMAGVGKTTLIKNINNKLTRPSPVSDSFSIVIWITVSNKTQETEFELKKVQQLIADRLKLTLTEESMETRAIRLHARLMMVKTFLLILDDIWDPIDLDLVGIPAPDVHKGGKLILTTRFSNVCLQMTDVTLKIEVLNEEEAWRLFCRSAGEVATSEEVEPLARSITKECAGLPLAIDVVGASLRGKIMIELWNDALNALRRSEPLIRGRIEDRVYNPIKWSYDVLPNECIKSCFLFSCLFPEDFQINVNTLVRYWLAEGLLEEHLDIEEVMDRGVAIIETLKDCSLLEHVDRSAVKIHDVIRDVSVWISSSLERECKSLVRSGIGLHKMRKDELLIKSYKRVSFMDNQMRELPDALGECPTTSTLLLQRNKMLEEIPGKFLLAFKSLRILDLSECTSIKSLPALDRLTELRALLLDKCSNLETLPPVGGLAKLQVFVCSETRIATLPQGMEKLTSLKLLDLSYNRLTVIPVGTMSCLSNLEHLDIRGNSKLKFIGERGYISTQFEEILSNERLIDLFIDVDNSACTLERTDTLLNRIKKLKRLELSIGLGHRPVKFPAGSGGHFMKLVSLNDIHLWGERIEWLFASTHSITFTHCKGLSSMFEKLVANSNEVGCLDTLWRLNISNCADWVGVGSNAKFDMLPNLKDIYISTFTNMSCILDLALPLGLKLSRLRRIRFINCSQLKYFISLGTTILTLEKLEYIFLNYCEHVEQVFRLDQNLGLDSVSLPNLKRITLRNCPKLRCISEVNIAFPQLEEVVVEKCPLLKKLPVTLQNVGSIKKIEGERKWWDELEWENDDFKKLYTPVLHLY
ncbi:UNVERIFIED_CONTAM: Disease resistance protein [Sesamum calycinum]|uniref:Disease resistance protein n=1 Tax=Sesamum calycinum TaxID=2727403 RepID=A0AAW2T1G9_9LAMI